MAVELSELLSRESGCNEISPTKDKRETGVETGHSPGAALICHRADSIFWAAERCLDHASKSCLVVDDDRRLLGSVSLERIRQAIVDGTGIENPQLDRYLLPADAMAPMLTLAPGGNGARRDPVQPIFDRDGRVVDALIDRSADPVQVARPNLSYRELRALLDALLSSWISGKGPRLREFERAFAAWVGTQHGVAVANGTVALHLALTSLGIGPGDEVIVPDITFAATINAVLYCGATPVIVDVDRDTWTLTAAQVRPALSPKTKAIMPVHLYGRPAEMGPIVTLAKERGCFIVEDCAEAHGARYAGRRIGSFSDIACFSFHSNKIVATGEGGMCLLDDAALARQATVFRDHGMVPGRIYWHEQVGYNYCMTNLQAALGLAQLARVEETIAFNRGLEHAYREHLADIPGVHFAPQLGDPFEPVVWLVSVEVPADKRGVLIDRALEAGIELRPFFHALSTMPLYRPYARSCVNSLRLSETGLNLPTSKAVDASVIARVADIFRRVLA